MEFACTGCGSCCKRIGQFKDKLEALNFPYKADHRGWCEMLDEKTNQCKVYERRPEICSIEKTFNKHLSNIMTKKEAFLIQARSCNQFIREDKLENKYLIDEKNYN